MSAQITYEPRTIEQLACYVNTFGYVLCAGCYHAGAAPDYARSRDMSGACDRCGTALIYSVEIVNGIATIEHTPVRIF